MIKKLINVVKGLDRDLCLLDRESQVVSEDADLSKNHRDFGKFIYDKVQDLSYNSDLIYGIISDCIFNDKEVPDELYDKFLDTFDFFKSTDEIYNNLIKFREE